MINLTNLSDSFLINCSTTCCITHAKVPVTHYPYSGPSFVCLIMPALTDCPMPSEILCLSQVFGLFPVSLSASPGIGVLLRCISVANSVAVLVITFFSLYYAPDIFDTLNAIGLFVDIIQIMAPILTHLVICVEALVRVNDYKKFWFQFGRTFATLQKLNGPLQEELMGVYRRVGLQLGILFVVPLLIEIRILWGIFDNYWVYSRLAAQFSFIGCRLSYLQLCLHLALINWVLQLLANEMQRLSNGSRSQLKSVEWEMTSQVAYRRILLVQQASKDVVELTSHLNQCYRWSLVANLTNNFLSITIAFYWNLRSLYFNNLKYQAGEFLL